MWTLHTFGGAPSWHDGDLRITKTGMGDDLSYCVYAGKLYLGSERTLEAAQTLAHTRKRKETSHVGHTEVCTDSPGVGDGPPHPVGSAVYPVNGRVRGSLVEAFYPKKETA